MSRSEERDLKSRKDDPTEERSTSPTFPAREFNVSDLLDSDPEERLPKRAKPPKARAASSPVLDEDADGEASIRAHGSGKESIRESIELLVDTVRTLYVSMDEMARRQLAVERRLQIPETTNARGRERLRSSKRPPSVMKEPRQTNVEMQDDLDEEQMMATRFFTSRIVPAQKKSQRGSSLVGESNLRAKLKGKNSFDPPDPPSSSPSSSSSTETSDDSAKERRQKERRRDTIFDPLPKRSPVRANLSGAVHDGILRTGPPEDTSDISLNVFSVSAWFNFEYRLTQYEFRNGIRLRAAARVSEDVIHRVLACNDVPITDPLQFLELSEKRLQRYLQRALRPVTVFDFATSLKRSTRFKSSTRNPNVLSPEEFERFYADLMSYTRNFYKVFLYLSHKNEWNVPQVDNKEPLGLIYLYLNGIPFSDFTKKVMTELRTNRAPNIRSFLEDTFLPKIRDILVEMQRQKKTKPYFAPTSSTSSSHQKSDPKSSSSPATTSTRSSTPFFRKKSASLHAIAAEQQEDDSDDECVPLEGSQNVDSQRTFSERSPDVHDERSETEEEPMKSVPAGDLDMEEIQRETLAAISSSRSTSSNRPPGRLYEPSTKSLGDSKPTGVCYTKLTQGSCTKPGCSFIHSDEAIIRELAQLAANWKNGRFNAVTSPTPRDVFPKRPPPEPPPSREDLLNAIYEPVVESFTFPEYVLNNVSMHVLNLVSSSSQFVDAVFHNGEIRLPKSEPLPFKALLDTGALHASYMSKDFHRLHWNVLETFTERCEAQVKMADNVTTAKIRNRVTLDVVITSPDGVQYPFKDTFNVIDCAHDVILGLPTIVTNVLPLLTSSLNAAKQRSPNVTEQPLQAERSPNVVLNVHELIENPWSFVDEIAPEDCAPVPCSFSEPIYYMSMSHEEAVAQYKALLDTHVDPEFAKNTDILKLLVSEVGLGCFIPRNWNGVKIDPVTLKTKDDLPERKKPPARNINPKLWDVAKKEYDRLMTYFYVKSDSPRVSPLVIAPKATEPFIRFAGDYSVWVNKFMLTGHWPIPNVRHSLEKIAQFSLFGDIDLTNGFHQIPICDKTSNLLSIQTPWGTVRPRFLPEGVPQGSGLLQEIMMMIFSEYDDWTIIIFDNLLVLAHDYQDMYVKVEKILKRALEYNLVFKMKKTWLGVRQVTFFGYVCKEHSYTLSEERLKGIEEMQMPMNKKAVKRFLGTAGFFIPFIPNYSIIVAPLHDMTKDSFDWDPKSWKVDYVNVFNSFKSALKEAATLFYPDYSLDWILRADASELGVGVVLFQVFLDPDGNKINQPLLFASKKFSDQAKKWSTYAQEAFAMFFGFKTCEYYLRGKKFTYEGDHANLQWMERSTEAKVIRQRLYMQGFGFNFNHIPGMENGVADWQSRFEELFEFEDFDNEYDTYTSSEQLWNVCVNVSSVEVSSLNEIFQERPRTRSQTRYDNVRSPDVVNKRPFSEVSPNVAEQRPRFDRSPNVMKQRPQDVSEQRTPPERSPNVVKKRVHFEPTTSPSALPDPNAPVSETINITRREMLDTAHQDRGAHLGIRRTYETLNRLFPGHGISMAQVTAYKELCIVCQKTEDYMSTQLVPIVRHLKTTNPGKVVGIDFLTLVLDKFGNIGVYVLRDHFSKLLFVYPARSHDSMTAAFAIFTYCVLYGAFDVLMSDPGSELTSDAVAQVNKWFGIHHRLSLVDRHESNGVEGANKQIIRHLSKLFMTERIKDEWSSPQHIGWVTFIMNKYDSSESGASPYDLTFGTVSNRRFDFPSGTLDPDQTHKYVKLLNDSLKALSSAAARYQSELVQKRTSVNQLQNVYQKGDLVLFRLNRDKPRPHKLHPIYLGPYEVLEQTKNDVQVRHMAMHTISTFYVGDLKVFYGSRSDAQNLASVDADQYLVSRVSAYRGDPLLRSSMYFFVEYADSDKLWIPWSHDLQNTDAYHLFCSSRQELAPLLLDTTQKNAWLRDLRKRPITKVKPNQQLLVDVRSFGADWYSTLTLPDKDTHVYLAPVLFKSLSANKRLITLSCPLLGLTNNVDNVYVTLYVPAETTARPHTVLDPTFLSEHPSLLVAPSNALSKPADFDYLVGRSFFETDARSKFHVTRIAVTRTNDIVAYVRPYKRDGTLGLEDKQPYHVADVVDMVSADSN